MSKELKTVLKAFDELEKAANVFQNAIYKFKKVYDPASVGLNEWAESVDETLFDIDQEIASDFDGDEE